MGSGHHRPCHHGIALAAPSGACVTTMLQQPCAWPRRMDSYTFDAHSKELLVHLTALQELRHLDLAGALWELPDNYTQLAQLTHLALPSCGTFGEEIAALKELRVRVRGGRGPACCLAIAAGFSVAGG